MSKADQIVQIIIKKIEDGIVTNGKCPGIIETLDFQSTLMAMSIKD